jgi:hypothetical protein
MDKSLTDIFQVAFDEKQVVLSDESLIELLGVLPTEILMILRESYPEGKIFKELKKSIEFRLQVWLSKKNKPTSFTDQAIYYQLRKLKDLGFIDTSSDRNIANNDRLVTSQTYKLASLNFVINLTQKNPKELVFKSDSSLPDTEIPSFFSSFNDNHKFNGFIVIGDRSKDGPFIGPISFLLSKYFDIPDPNSVVLVDTKLLEDADEKKIGRNLSKNLILLGGQFVNNILISTFHSESGELVTLNDSLPVKFLQAGVYIKDKSETISSKDVLLGVIQLVDNPWNLDYKILTIGGSRRVGTEAAVRELSKSLRKIEDILLRQKYCLIEAYTDSKGQLINSKVLD